MYSKRTIIINEHGLHARPGANLAIKAKEFNSKITIKKIGVEKNPATAKSVIALMSLGLTKGNEVEITAVGDDEIEAVKALISFIDLGCGE